MASAVKKKRPAAKKKAVLGAAGQAALDEHEAWVDERYAFAMSVKENQDDATVVAINRMVSRMQQMAGAPYFKFKGISVQADEQRLRSIQVKMFTWMAVRILAACAEWDIRIANFKSPKKCCSKCGKKVK